MSMNTDQPRPQRNDQSTPNTTASSSSSSSSSRRNDNKNSSLIATTTREVVSSTPKESIELLRVARHELLAGQTTGPVYMRLSSGAVAFPIDRSTLQARVDRQIVQTIESFEKQNANNDS
jgi:hypothetical protein